MTLDSHSMNFCESTNGDYFEPAGHETLATFPVTAVTIWEDVLQLNWRWTTRLWTWACQSESIFRTPADEQAPLDHDTRSEHHHQTKNQTDFPFWVSYISHVFLYAVFFVASVQRFNCYHVSVCVPFGSKGGFVLCTCVCVCTYTSSQMFFLNQCCSCLSSHFIRSFAAEEV